MAAAIAPIGVVVGRWVGAWSGLSHVMPSPSARMRTMMSAARFVLAPMTILLRAGIDRLLRRVLYWAPDTMRMA